MKLRLLAFAILALWSSNTFAQIEPGWATMDDSGTRAAEALTSGAPASSFTIPELRGFTASETAEPSGGGGFAPMSIVTGAADAITPEITELARGLGNDPVRIFNHVFNHIDYDHYFGSKKGASGTLMEGRGNSFDTAALMVAMLRSSGYTAEYRYGPAQFTFNELSNWCHFNLTPYSHLSETQFRTQFGLTGVAIPISDLKKYVYVFNFNDQRGYPYTDCGDLGSGANYYQIPHVWVRVTVNGQTWEVDPSFKTYNHYIKEDVKARASFNRANFLTDIGGATGTNYATGLSDSTLGARLTTYSTNIRNWIRNNNSGTQLIAFTGGPKIIEREIADFGEAWSVLYASRAWLSVTTWPTTIPAAMMSKYELTSGTLATNGTFTPGTMTTSIQMPVLNGQKLALIFSGNIAKLQLNDVDWETFTVSGASVDLRIKATHPIYNYQYNSSTGVFDTVNVGRADHQEIKNYKKSNANAYAFVYGFQNPAMQLRKRQEQLDKYRRLGYTDTDSRVQTEILNVMGLTWLMEVEMSNYLLATQVDVARVYQHRFGRVAQETNFYIDAGLNLESIQAKSGVQREHDIYLAIGSMLASSLEHGVLEQLQGLSVTGASAVKMLHLANSTNVPIYRATSANWSGAGGVKAQLTGYPAAILAEIEDSVLNRSGAILIPKSGSLTLNSWTGYGYYLSEPLLANFKITGGLKGGYSTSSGTVDTFTLAKWLASDPSYLWAASALLNLGSQPTTTPSYYGADPVEMASGGFVVDRQDISLGDKVPRGLSFSRHYHSNNNYNKAAALGYGWTHSYNMYVSQSSGIKAGLGQTTVSHMSPYLVACAVAAEIYRGGTNTPKEMTAMALVSKWAVDQLRNNGVGVVVGNRTYQFVLMPDGSYEPPAGTKMTLEKVGSDFVLKERHGPIFTFDSTNNNKVKLITDPWGNQQTFTYSGGKLNVVTDSFNRTLTFGYSGGDKITSVTDGARTFSFGYTGDTLITATDVENKAYTYTYDGENRITELRDPDTRLITMNTYDAEGRVDTQKSMGDNARLWKFYYTGFCNIEEDPAGGQKKYLFDDRGRSTGTIDALGNFEGRGYDGQDRIVAVVTPEAELSSYTFNADHNVVTETDPLNKVTTYTYNADKEVETVTDKRGKVTTYTYWPEHVPHTVTDPLGNQTVYTYTNKGLLLTSTDGESKTTTYGYDTYGSVSKVTSHDSTEVNYTNNPQGDVLTVTDAENRTTTKTWNKRRQLLTSTLQPIAGEPTSVTTNVYDNCGNLQSTTDGKGNTSSYAWNALARRITATLPTLPAGNNVDTTSYDLRDWPTGLADSAGRSVTTEYDDGGRATAVLDALNRRRETTYDANGRVTATKDALNRITNYGWSDRGEKSLTTNPMLKTVNEVYDENGNRKELTNRNGKTFTTVYDDANRPTSLTTPTGKATLMTYWNNGLVKTIQEASGQTATMAYNGKNLLQTKSDPTGNISYTYDDSGLLETVTEGTSVITRTYDQRGRLKTYKLTQASVIQYLLQYDYDANGNLAKITYPDGKEVSYTHNERNQLSTVTDWRNKTTTYNYDRLGRLVGINHANGTITTMDRDNADQLKAVRSSFGGKLFSYINLGYDNAGQIINKFQAPLTNAAWQHPTFTGTYDNDNRLLTANGSAVVHDADGNMTSGPISQSSGTVSLTYNSRNQLTSAGGITYTYDAEGRRLTSTSSGNTTNYVVDPGGALSRMLVKKAPDGTLIFYVYGLGLLYEVDESDQAKTYHFDQTGSTIVRTNDSGSVIGRAFYSAYGLIAKKEGDMNTSFLYNGEAGVSTEENGLLHMRARYYSPYLMRFLNADPMGFTGGLNWFAYANGDPISTSDPFGLWGWKNTFGVLKAVGGAFEAVAGAALATATGVSGVGLVAGIAVAAHGVDTFQSGIRQAISGEDVDTFTSKTILQDGFGMEQNTANLVDAGISVVGSMGAGSMRAATQWGTVAIPSSAATMSTAERVIAYEIGQKTLDKAPYIWYAGRFENPIERGAAMIAEQGWIQVITPQASGWRLGLGVTFSTGPTPAAWFGVGALGAAERAGSEYLNTQYNPANSK
ncbi:MAG: RHS repeat-associated core domain-containing protein [Luteolibacter sp.]|nr:RHS repeat-associated core domain-containing protein [Luteolibacter sp.]